MNDLLADRYMRFALLAVFVLLALFLLAKTWDAAFGRGPNEPYNTITVTGTGEAVVIPDIAQIDFTVTENASTVGEAQTKSTERVDAALDAVKQLGIEEKDIKTTYYAVNPRYEYSNQTCGYGMPCPPSGPPTIVGYEVAQSIQMKVRDTAKAGQVLEVLGSLGVQNISGPHFTVDDEDAVKGEAREEAIKEAREKAKELAKQLGVRLGRTVSFYENEGGYPMPYGKGGGMDAAMETRVSAVAPTLPMGENETSVSVSVTYEIH
ncbi:MAG: SIMPL domain-containing protein [Patescibacteria group bacterium]